jgi:uncharacterized protein YjiS (DUF1127 family)
MASEMLQRPDLTAYVVAGLPKNFLSKLKKAAQEQSAEAEVMQLDEELTDWLVAQIRGEKRRPHERTPASAALWRAYRALSAARYHLQDRPEEEQVRELRRLVEQLWQDLSPQFPEGGGEEGAGDGEDGADDESQEEKE